MFSFQVFYVCICTPYYWEHQALSSEAASRWIELFDVLMFTRLLIFFDYAKYFSVLNTYRGRIVCKMTNVTVNDQFLIRTYLHQHPIETLLITSFFLLIVSSYCLYVFERETNYKAMIDGDTEIAIEYHEHIWLLVVTVMTVGYGDIYPRTTGGRFISMSASLCGLVWSATLIGVINNSIALSYQERIVISYLD